MANFDELLIDELNAPLARNLEKLDLRLDEEVKGHFGDKETGSRTSRVADSSSDIEGG